jgi:phage gpG-like protein
LIITDVSYNIKGLAKLIPDHLQAIYKGLQNGLLIAERWSKESFNKAGHLKVRTGNLRRSISHAVIATQDGAIGSLYTNVKYAPPHELGLPMRKRSGGFYLMPKRAFLKPAIEKNVKAIAKQIVEEMKKI